MSEVTVPENPEPVDAEETQDSAGEQDSEAEEDAGVVVMLRSRLVMVMLGRTRLRNSFSPGC